MESAKRLYTRKPPEVSAVEREAAKRIVALRNTCYARKDRCGYCGKEPNYDGGQNDQPSIDHATPTSRGGSEDIENLIYCCRGCNGSKNGSTIAEARPRLLLRRLGWPYFTAEHLAWMRSKGFDLSELDAAQLWFEERGISADELPPYEAGATSQPVSIPKTKPKPPPPSPVRGEG